MADGDSRPDGAGLEALVGAHRPELLRFLAARCGDAAEAEDLLQELWLKAALAITGPVANGRAYLFRMANNLVLDRARARRRAMQRDREWIGNDEGASGAVELRPDPSPGAEAQLIDAEEGELVRRAVAALPERARRALMLYRFEDRGQSEIAQIMGISRSGVEKHLALAMKQLRQRLADCGFFDAASSLDQEAVGGTAPNRKARP